jgi:hypothetical protein
MMGIFKKNSKRPAVTELKCPSTGCSFTSYSDRDLKRHIEWKHPELLGNSEK